MIAVYPSVRDNPRPEQDRSRTTPTPSRPSSASARTSTTPPAVGYLEQRALLVHGAAAAARSPRSVPAPAPPPARRNAARSTSCSRTRSRAGGSCSRSSPRSPPSSRCSQSSCGARLQSAQVRQTWASASTSSRQRRSTLPCSHSSSAYSPCWWAASSGRRAQALAVPAVAAVAAYLVNALAAIVSWLEPAQKASPFYHYVAGDPLRHGIAPTHSGLLLLAVAVLAGLAPLAFTRRDLT